MPNYFIWVQYWEGDQEVRSSYGFGRYCVTDDVLGMDTWRDNVVRYESKVADSFQKFNLLEEDGEDEEHELNPNAQRFYQLLELVHRPLWESQFSLNFQFRREC
ncbi:hypothetical protein PIB30_076085 [Stylosanthes scabra]|uniref:Uncharacterized protein n=1 Tax=Stylosanthes scabra TaxID=79078 RepID=A0ABU6RQG4_9FABA|nr:hypothetical protein [Stylosanthes scabra]